MKTAISIPDSLFEAADTFAEKKGISRSLLYQRAVELYLKTRGEDVIRESLDDVYREEDLSRMDPAIEFLQGRSVHIDKDEW
jgi:metal-responsive CopG/Arc/MetJ family transcriptional regulator